MGTPDLVEAIERSRSVVLLTPAGGDECDQASDNEEVPQGFEMASKPAGELKVKEDINGVEESQIGFLIEEIKRRKQALKKIMCWD